MTRYKLTFQENFSIKYEPGLTIDLVENEVWKCAKDYMKLGHSDLVYMSYTNITDYSTSIFCLQYRLNLFDIHLKYTECWYHGLL